MNYDIHPAYKDMIDHDWMWSDINHIKGSYDSYPLPVGGFLVAVTLEMKWTEDFKWSKLDEQFQLDGMLWYEITDPDGVALYSKIGVPYGSGFHKGGKLMDEPLPNLNSAQPYMLHLPKYGPDIIVTTLRYQVLSQHQAELNRQKRENSR